MYEGFCYTDLQDELNDRLLNCLPYNTVNITESHPLGFKYYREGGNRRRPTIPNGSTAAG